MNGKPTPNPISLSQHIVYVCSRLLAYGLPLLYFLVTISFYLKTYDSAQIKITFTQIGGTFLLIVWLTKILVEGRLPFKKSDLVFVLPFLAFLASGLIAWAHSPFKGWAMEETIRRVFYMVMALITIAEFGTDERMKRLWRWLMAAAWVAIGYGVIQFLDSRLFPSPGPGIDPFIWRQAFTHRVFSTFGNPNFYGNFLVILTPLILASVLRSRGPFFRPFALVVITVSIIFVTDKMTRGSFGGYDPSFQVVWATVLVLLIGLFVFASMWKVGASGNVPMFLILFALLFLNLYSTETKGAWLGFMAATAVTVLLVVEYFFRLEERVVKQKSYILFVSVLTGLIALTIGFMTYSFVIPWVTGAEKQSGFSILWIPTALGAVFSLVTLVWVFRKPWNVKKILYGALVFFILAMGGGVLEYAKNRLTSVSFRLFTWISTWEMIRTQPILGNGVGTFKIIYPAYRRPEIIVLEGKSNTETDHAEDEYLEVWQDEGIVGFGIFLWLILTAVVCGFKQLRWYSNIRAPDQSAKKKLMATGDDPRSYEVLGFLGAYIGALIHWSVDVSIRFVSSGIFSGLLPGVLVSYARNHENHVREEARLPYERWIRVGLAAFWTGVMLWLGLELVPQRFIEGGDTKVGQIRLFAILVGAGIFLLMELLEWGLAPEKPMPFAEQYPPVERKGIFWRWPMVAAVIFVSGFGFRMFAHHFFADVHHNLAIFFSKQSIWKKMPRYEPRINQLPPDIRKQYQKYGGALEHYEQVQKKNPYFPMARYFTGNVYNDWGSQFFNDSMTAREQQNMAEAQRLRERTTEMWEAAEEAYENTKKLAPNYVQTHHQLGLLYTKRAEQAARWGEMDQAKHYYESALDSFYKYRMLDPVFPPNYDRIAQILIMEGRFQEAEELYREAIQYNTDVVLFIHKKMVFGQRLAEIYVSLAKVYFTEARSKHANPFQPVSPEIQQAIESFRKATEVAPLAEAWKGLGYLLQQTGDHAGSQTAYRKALELSPNDPELKANAS